MVIINNLTFNQDYSCISVSTTKYHKIFNCDPFGEFYSSYQGSSGTKGDKQNDNDKEIIIDKGNGNEYNKIGEDSPTLYLKMLFSTSLTIIIPENESVGNRLLKIYNLKQNMKICELTFPSHIIDVKLNRKRLCVILESGQIYIYDLSCVRLIKVLEISSFSSNDSEEETHQKLFVGDLGADDKSLLVLPISNITEQTDLFNTENGVNVTRASDSNILTSLKPLIEFTKNKINKDIITLEDLQKDSNGWVLIYDTIKLKPRLIYKAHDSSLAKITISNDNKKIATASSKGTIIRVCHLESSDDDDVSKPFKISQIINLRRGHNIAKVNCLSFSLDNLILGCGSESNTIHFFRLLKQPHESFEYEEDPANESDPDNEDRSSEDLNQNLANLLISKTADASAPDQKDLAKSSYFDVLKKKVEGSSRFMNNPYTQTIVKNLPYKNYFENLIWEPPRRSFAYIKLPEYIPPQLFNLHQSKNKVAIGFANTNNNGHLIMLASYQTGQFYHYQLPKPSDLPEPSDLRHECNLIAQYSLL
ncbi:unnamed protein product [Debaryomyces tyrocola]|nr:unnamed protein product [Debaryomyces tyrocola]